MVNALKKIDKKFLIVIGCIVFLPIVVIIFLAIIQGCSNLKTTHAKYEQKMISAMQSYLEDKDNKPTKEGQSVTVKLSKLVDGEYIKSPEKALGDDTCSGSVTVRKNGSTVEENKGGFLNYTVSLECENYKTNSLENSLMKDLVSVGSGLYKQGNEYVFKGDDVDNYITFFGTSYRIVSMDDDGIVKLLKAESESSEDYWDIKYNVDTGSATGKNIYADSEINKTLIEIYNNPKKFSEESKKHLISKDICVGSRDINDLSFTSNPECSSVLENQVVSLLGVTDYANASLDPDCVDLNSKSCRNYNYMRKLFLDSWTYTAVSSNSYEVYYIYNGLIKHQSANQFASYSLVIYVDGDEILSSGDGTEKSPYVIK
ncbi:MAG: hypothetical protein IJY25_05145 [Bacilli bacterium]|nr:hypothetical protein [Bacilli bacterium]